MKISVIIVYWNTPDELRTLSSLLRQGSEGQVSKKDIEIIVIDNNSDKKLEINNQKLKLIENKTNLGFAAACNQGAKIAKGEWLLFLNPDTYISSQNVLRFLRKAEELNYDAASLKPSSSNYSKPLPSALSLLVEFSPLRRFISLNIFRQKTLFGGGLLIKRSVFNKLGGWDERFFLWFEDSDLTRRLLDNEYKIGWINVPHTHAGGTSFKKLSDSKRKEIFFSSMNLYASKHFSFFGQLVVKFITFLNK